ncbi:MAG: NTP transferase domain-containing protein [Anaerolineales bacterium]|nr:NTP transferase domain-containing protein [Anaerolineales bacterium]
MKIVIPMAGYGTRLRPHTWSKPKPLVSVAGKPVLGHVLDMFSTLPDIDEVIFIVGYLGEQVEEYVSEIYVDLPARYVVQEEMLGQSHAIWLAREGLEGPMCMAFVDTIIEADLSFLPAEKAGAVAWVKEVEDPRRFGVTEVGDNGWVRRLVEKPDDMSNNLALAGFYYFNRAEALIAAIEKQMQQGDQLGGEFYLADAINVMLEEDLKMRVETVQVWKDCGKPDALLETNRYLLDHGRDNTAEAQQRDGSLIIPPVFIHPSAEISQAVIGPHVSVGSGCVIQRSVIQDSIIENETTIENALLSESLIGRGARITGRFKMLNIGDTSQVDAL